MGLSCIPTENFTIDTATKKHRRTRQRSQRNTLQVCNALLVLFFVHYCLFSSTNRRRLLLFPYFFVRFRHCFVCFFFTIFRLAFSCAVWYRASLAYNVTVIFVFICFSSVLFCVTIHPVERMHSSFVQLSVCVQTIAAIKSPLMQKQK